MIDHISIHVSDFEKSKTFYVTALAPLNYSVGLEFPQAVNLTPSPDDDSGTGIWIDETTDPITPTHIAFRAQTTDQVKTFYEAGLEAGGADNGAPGPRPNYGSGYYAAFVFDPDGNNIEAVLHDYLDDKDDKAA